ncbi:MAG: 3-isopropylmalate dehydratase small subunit [Candidatus Omnitrophota bacterium]
MRGKAWKFADNISTDLIAPGRYFHLRSNLPELAKHVLEDANADFAKKLHKGDFIVAGKNFGLGSSREHAAQIIKIAGAGAILAKSFSRIFFRNAINVGIPAIAADTSKIKEGDELEIDLEKGLIRDVTRNFRLKFAPLPKIMTDILKAGGLVKYIRKYKDFKL